jgi:hypothetical protein
VKIVREVKLIECGTYYRTLTWRRTRSSLYNAIRAVDWPPGSGTFTIYPESGKKRGEGNGVKPIKNGLMTELRRQGWTVEGRGSSQGLGSFDAMLGTEPELVVLEWETGNISSSHRSLNKMAMLLSKGLIAAGILVVPSRELYRYLTDRIGNISELEPYFDLWRSIPCKEGILEIAVVQHDAESRSVPKIPKGTDGRAKR